LGLQNKYSFALTAKTGWLAFLPVFKAHLNKSYILQQCMYMYIVYLSMSQIYVIISYLFSFILNDNEA